MPAPGFDDPRVGAHANNLKNRASHSLSAGVEKHGRGGMVQAAPRTWLIRWSHSSSDSSFLYRKARGLQDTCSTSPRHSSCDGTEWVMQRVGCVAEVQKEKYRLPSCCRWKHEPTAHGIPSMTDISARAHVEWLCEHARHHKLCLTEAQRSCSVQPGELTTPPSP